MTTNIIRGALWTPINLAHCQEDNIPTNTLDNRTNPCTILVRKWVSDFGKPSEVMQVTCCAQFCPACFGKPHTKTSRNLSLLFLRDLWHPLDKSKQVQACLSMTMHALYFWRESLKIYSHNRKCLESPQEAYNIRFLNFHNTISFLFHHSVTKLWRKIAELNDFLTGFWHDFSWDSNSISNSELQEIRLNGFNISPNYVFYGQG